MIDTKKNSDKMEEPIANMIIKVKYNAGYVKENIAENGKDHIFQYKTRCTKVSIIKRYLDSLHFFLISQNISSGNPD